MAAVTPSKRRSWQPQLRTCSCSPCGPPRCQTWTASRAACLVAVAPTAPSATAMLSREWHPGGRNPQLQPLLQHLGGRSPHRQPLLQHPGGGDPQRQPLLQHPNSSTITRQSAITRRRRQQLRILVGGARNRNFGIVVGGACNNSFGTLVGGSRNNNFEILVGGRAGRLPRCCTCSLRCSLVSLLLGRRRCPHVGSCAPCIFHS